ncbi:MAG: ferredoxin-type protein NapG [Ectothiorhodospiraceae bacterium]|nr:ferredoxin-type protein NapG [Ectothiorhodospiraceae bacterium]
MSTDRRPRSAASRRRFLGDVARGAGAAVLLGAGLGLHARRSAALAPTALRPPGALAEEAFQAACLRCGLCVRDCPYPTLRLAGLDEDVTPGTPYFVARSAPCEMCDDLPCVAACPSGALSPSLTDVNDARMGVAVLVDQETCLNFLGLRCDVCHRVCPLIDEAITLERTHNTRTGKHARFLPTVHADACTGCGKCEQACVLEEAAIKVLPRSLAKGELGRHYRLGWEEKARNQGEALVPGIMDLPDRMPGSGGGS